LKSRPSGGPPLPYNPHSAARPPPYLAVLAADRDQPRRPKLACAFPEMYCSDRRALLLECILVCLPPAHKTDRPTEHPSPRSSRRRPASGRAQRMSWKPQIFRKMSDACSLEDNLPAALFLNPPDA
ncbi:hypothetical protein EJB05_01784, partial [Eragrostis curvula]